MRSKILSAAVWFALAAQAIAANITVTNVAGLYTARPGNGDIVTTLGYTTAGIGANSYRYVRNSVAAVNGVTVMDGPGGNGTGIGVGRYLALKTDVIDVTQAGAVPDVASDSGPAIRAAIASGKPVRLPKGVYTVAHDPASAFDDGGTTRYAYSLNIPSNAVLTFDDGATIKQADGAQSWTRTIVLNGVSNVNIFGELKVDANVSGRGATTNEHMHGVFIFDSTDVYIQRIDSRNARGDNVFIGGTDEDTVSSQIRIDSIVGVAAGRKNLVLQQFDDVTIGSAYLDNTTGGAELWSATPNAVADDTDKHCLDVEPDAFTGAEFHRATIGSLITKGTGADFTSAVTSAAADKCIITIGSWDHDHYFDAGKLWLAGVKPIVNYGATVNVQRASFNGMQGITEAFQFWYGSRFNCNRMVVSGSTPAVDNPMILIAQNGGNRPRVRIDNLELTNTIGSGVEVRDGDLSIGRYVARTAGIVGWARGLSSTAGLFTEYRVGELDMENVGAPAGAGYAFYVSKAGSLQPVVEIKHTAFRDNRSPDLNYIYLFDTGTSAELILGSIENQSAVTNINWLGADKYYRMAGGGSGPRVYVCQGTPEAMVVAPVGSTAVRTDGGSGTVLYTKDSGTANTGWGPLGGADGGHDYLDLFAGSLTDNRPALDITQTWDDVTEDFFGLRMALTTTNFNPPSKAVQIYTGLSGTTDIFSIDTSGNVNIPNQSAFRVWNSGHTDLAASLSATAGDNVTLANLEDDGALQLSAATNGLIQLITDGVSQATLDDDGFSLAAGNWLEFNGTTSIKAGTGSPEGAITATVGSLYMQTDAATGLQLWSKDTGTGNTGWLQVGTGGGTSGDGTFTALTADDATPDVTDLRLVETANTVGTAYTNFEGGTEGQLLEIHVTDNNTSFVDNSNLRLLGNADIDASGSPYRVAFRHDGTAWRQLWLAPEGQQFLTSVDGTDLTLANEAPDSDINFNVVGAGAVINLDVNGTDRLSASNTGVNLAGVTSINSAVTIHTGTDPPEGVVSANVGSIYIATNAIGDSQLWTKETGSGNTGWVQAGTSAQDPSFGTVSFTNGQSSVVADTVDDEITLVEGAGIDLVSDAGTDTITITSTGGGGGDGTFTALTADDPTPDATGLRLVTTANGTITSYTNFENGTEGQLLEIHVNDANSAFVNNSNLALIGGVNIPASTDPYRIVFRHDGTQWKQLALLSEGHQIASSTDGSDNITLSNSTTDADLTLDVNGASSLLVVDVNGTDRLIVDNAGVDVAGVIDLNGVDIRTGTGSPETVVTGDSGDLFFRTDGGATTSAYIKSDDADNTGWVAFDFTGGGGLSDIDYGDITVSGSGTVMTIDADAVTYSKIQDVSATDRILGRDTAGAGVVEEITPANLRTMLNVEDGADVTDATNVEAAGAVMVADTSTSGYAFVIDEDSFATNSATLVPTQQSVKAYVDANSGGLPAGGTVGDLVVNTGSGTGSWSSVLSVGAADVTITQAGGQLIAPAGDSTNPTIALSTQTNTGLIFANNTVSLGTAGTSRLTVTNSTAAATIGSTGYFGICSASSSAGTADVLLFRDAAAQWGFRNGTTAQSTAVYGTYTSSTNYERLRSYYDSGTTSHRLHGENGSGGGTARHLALGTDETDRLIIDSAGANSRFTTPLLHPRLVEASTAGSGTPNVLIAAESNTTLTNQGTTAANYHTLPSASAGQVFRFRCLDADGIRVTAASGDDIRMGANVTAAAGYVESAVIGNWVELEAIDATTWVASWYGQWTDGTFTTANSDRHPIGMVTESTDQTSVNVFGKSAILFSNPNPVTVTTFTGAESTGHMIHVMASNGNTTIDNGTTIKCIANTDLLLNSNDGATFCWNGSAWIQTGYSDNSP